MGSLVVYEYDRIAAVSYAETWWNKRNPKYGDFTGIGGDCTNFTSQCLMAGGAVMNPKSPMGWHYYSMTSRTPSWTGVPFFFDFITKNEGVGPFGHLVSLNELMLGDIVQLGKSNGHFYHSLLVVSLQYPRQYNTTFITTHTVDVNHRALSDYTFDQARFIHIDGIRKST